MASGVWNRIRVFLLRPLPKTKLNAYVAIASCIFGFLALFYAGRTFQLQRRDSLLFELERRYEQEQRLLLSTECFVQNAHAVGTDAMEKLRQVSSRRREVLSRRAAATMNELLDAHQRSLEDSDAASAVSRYLMNERVKLEIGELERLNLACGL